LLRDRCATCLQKRKKVAATAALSQTARGTQAPGMAFQKAPPQTTAWRLSPENLKELNRFLAHLKRKAYSASSVKTYRNEFLQLLQLQKQKPLNELTPDDLRRYML
jgi:hypothetical protein